MRIYRFPYSTNVERVALALGHKGISPEWLEIDPADRSEVERVSGQPLVPVLVADDGEVVVESMDIVRFVDERHPDPPLYPRDAAERARMLVFIDWFNRVWKVAPNAIDGVPPGDERVPRWQEEMRHSLHLFEDMLAGGPFLFGDELSAADCAAFPFLKYGLLGCEPDDTDSFHAVLVDNLPVEEHPSLTAWVRRMDAMPRA